MVEDLIVRFRLKDHQLMYLSFFYGTIYLAFTSGIVFLPPVSAGGIRWVELLYVNLVWWGALQAVLTFYFANLIAPRSFDHSLLSKNGWILCLVIQIVTLFLFQKSGLIPKGSPAGYMTILIILIASLLIFWKSIKKQSAIIPFQSNRILTILSFATVCVFLVCFLFLVKDPILSGTSHVNALSLKIVTRWTLVLAVIMLMYRIKMKKNIPV
jgi:hypothetical protein